VRKAEIIFECERQKSYTSSAQKNLIPQDGRERCSECLVALCRVFGLYTHATCTHFMSVCMKVIESLHG